MYFRLFLRWFLLRFLPGFKKKHVLPPSWKYAWKLFPNTKKANLNVSDSFLGELGGLFFGRAIL